VSGNLVQAAYETVGVASSGYACIIEVKQSPDRILAQQQSWLARLSNRRPSVLASESAFDAQILALP
jgi:hypothetical protein